MSQQVAFKEKGPEKFYRDECGDWVKCDESDINAFWNIWVVSKGIKRYTDSEGFLVFDYN